MTKELEDILFRRAGPLLSERDFEKILRRTRPRCNYTCLGRPVPSNKENQPCSKGRTNQPDQPCSKGRTNQPDQLCSKGRSNQPDRSSREGSRGELDNKSSTVTQEPVAQARGGVKSRLGWKKGQEEEERKPDRSSVLSRLEPKVEKSTECLRLDGLSRVEDSSKYIKKKTSQTMLAPEPAEPLRTHSPVQVQSLKQSNSNERSSSLANPADQPNRSIGSFNIYKSAEQLKPNVKCSILPKSVEQANPNVGSNRIFISEERSQPGVGSSYLSKSVKKPEPCAGSISKSAEQSAPCAEPISLSKSKEPFKPFGETKSVEALLTPIVDLEGSTAVAACASKPSFETEVSGTPAPSTTPANLDPDHDSEAGSEPHVTSVTTQNSSTEYTEPRQRTVDVSAPPAVKQRVADTNSKPNNKDKLVTNTDLPKDTKISKQHTAVTQSINTVSKTSKLSLCDKKGASSRNNSSVESKLKSLFGESPENECSVDSKQTVKDRPKIASDYTKKEKKSFEGSETGNSKKSLGIKTDKQSENLKINKPSASNSKIPVEKVNKTTNLHIKDKDETRKKTVKEERGDQNERSEKGRESGKICLKTFDLFEDSDRKEAAKISKLENKKPSENKPKEKEVNGKGRVQTEEKGKEERCKKDLKEKINRKENKTKALEVETRRNSNRGSENGKHKNPSSTDEVNKTISLYLKI